MREGLLFALIEGSRITRPFKRRRLYTRDSLRRGCLSTARTVPLIDGYIELNFVRGPERQSLTSAGEPAETDIWQNMDMPQSKSNATVNILRIQLALLTHIEAKARTLIIGGYDRR